MQSLDHISMPLRLAYGAVVTAVLETNAAAEAASAASAKAGEGAAVVTEAFGLLADALAILPVAETTSAAAA